MWGTIKLISSGVMWTRRGIKLARKLAKQYKTSQAIVAEAGVLALDEVKDWETEAFIEKAKKARGKGNGK